MLLSNKLKLTTMSSRQLRRLRIQKSQAAEISNGLSEDRSNGKEENVDESSSSASSGDGVDSETGSSPLNLAGNTKKGSFFFNASSLLVNDDQDASDSDEQSDEEKSARITKVTAKPLATKKKSRTIIQRVKDNVEISLNDLENILSETVKTPPSPTPPLISHNPIIPLSALPPAHYSLLMKRDGFDPMANRPRLFSNAASYEERKKQMHLGDHSSNLFRRKYWLIPLQNLPPPGITNGLYMETCQNGDGTSTFVMKLTRRYAEILDHCHHILFMGNPHELLDLCRLHPFHVDLLLHTATILMQQNQSFSQVIPLIKNALLALQCNFLPTFSPFLRDVSGLPQVSVDSTNEINKVLFKAILFHMHSMGQGGHEAVAFELCKLAMAMDLRQDICHALLHVDGYALTARYYLKLLRFSHRFIMDHPTIFLSEALSDDSEDVEASTRSHPMGDRFKQKSPVSSSVLLPAVHTPKGEDENDAKDANEKGLKKATERPSLHSFSSSIFYTIFAAIPYEQMEAQTLHASKNGKAATETQLHIRTNIPTLASASLIDTLIPEEKGGEESIYPTTETEEIPLISLESLPILSGVSNLEFILPNFAFSCSLAICQAFSNTIKTNAIGAIDAETFIRFLKAPQCFFLNSKIHHFMLLRALLLFPDFLRTLLDKGGFTAQQTVKEREAVSLCCFVYYRSL
ncbi:hypothetical protein IE077_001014 [Cardiosporidium cionae]|uniref:Uncharacterized protein n=1 Tax=Cardiosporidium cionae TaxID=476202 RepID=A0ABQ7J627_9APIC|nr:hypothetical protein IE077_001014 [Cardiosporidium cionae]|eukprot:KAF8819447.1 hypothetical protein IE077_001014 [Cardiosporidium cionae]